MSDDRASKVTCPVCTHFREGENRTYANKWYLALHIAREAKMTPGGDQLHRRWVIKNCGSLNFKEYGVKEISKIAKVVYPVVKELSVNTSQDPRARLLNKVTRLEGELRSFVEKVLRKELGDRWWYDGVPEDVRVECAKQQQKEMGRKELFDYTYIIDQIKIFDKSRGHFNLYLGKCYQSPSTFPRRINRLNEIRNDVVHGVVKTKEQGQLLEFVTDFEEEIATMCKEL